MSAASGPQCIQLNRQVQVCNAQLTSVSTTCYKWAHSPFLFLFLLSFACKSKWSSKFKLGRKRNRRKIFWLPQKLIKSSAAIDLASNGHRAPSPLPTPSCCTSARQSRKANRINNALVSRGEEGEGLARTAHISCERRQAASWTRPR